MSVGLFITLGLVLLALTACGDGGVSHRDTAKGDGTEPAADELQAVVASYDIAVGPATRFILGIFNPKRGPIGYGTVSMRFFLGEGKEPGRPRVGPMSSASYLPLPGSPAPPADTSRPAYLSTDQRGVYAAEVAFDKAGSWGVEATVDIDGGARAVRTSFEVKPKHEVPAPGDAAIASKNLTVSTPGARPAAIDSRASATTAVPDA